MPGKKIVLQQHTEIGPVKYLHHGALLIRKAAKTYVDIRKGAARRQLHEYANADNRSSLRRLHNIFLLAFLVVYYARFVCIHVAT